MLESDISPKERDTVLHEPVMPNPGTVTFFTFVMLYRYATSSARLMADPMKKEPMIALGTVYAAFVVSSAMWPGVSYTKIRYCAISKPFTARHACG